VGRGCFAADARSTVPPAARDPPASARASTSSPSATT
jgi:hypothetical protein